MVHKFPKHQLSYTLVAAHADAGTSGWGDTILNYRYQLVGNGERAPRFHRACVLPPSGDTRQDAARAIACRPACLVSCCTETGQSLNAGSTFVPRNADHDRASRLVTTWDRVSSGWRIPV
jgi:hypothetical protein